MTPPDKTPATEAGEFLRNGLLAMGYDEESANEAILAIEAEARDIDAYGDGLRTGLKRGAFDALREAAERDVAYIVRIAVHECRGRLLQTPGDQEKAVAAVLAILTDGK